MPCSLASQSVVSSSFLRYSYTAATFSPDWALSALRPWRVAASVSDRFFCSSGFTMKLEKKRAAASSPIAADAGDSDALDDVLHFALQAAETAKLTPPASVFCSWRTSCTRSSPSVRERLRT